jgi:hypothetical protein
MKKEHEKIITQYVFAKPIQINAALLSAQNRVRLYWTNIHNTPTGLFGFESCTIPQPKDKGILLKDILETDVPEKYYLSENALNRVLKAEKIGIKAKINPIKSGTITCGNQSSRLCLNNSTTLIKKNGKVKTNSWSFGGYSGLSSQALLAKMLKEAYRIPHQRLDGSIKEFSDLQRFHPWCFIDTSNVNSFGLPRRFFPYRIALDCKNLIHSGVWRELIYNVDSELITGWTNDDFDTFTSSDTSITAASDIVTGGYDANAYTNTLTLTSGYNYLLATDITYTTGSTAKVYYGTSFAGATLIGTLSAGEAAVVFKAASTSASHRIYFSNQSDADFSASGTFSLKQITGF